MNRFAIWMLLLTTPSEGAIDVIYGDNPREHADIENVEVLKNQYLKKQALLEERIAQLEKEKLEVQQERDHIKMAKDQAKAKVESDDYKLSVDLTKKVVKHIGEMPSVLSPIASEGHGAPLSAAFNAIIPIDWKVYVYHTISDDRPINWNSNSDNWVATLYRIGVRYNYSFDINWNEQWVLVNESDLRFGLSQAQAPEITVMGLKVPPGTEGHILIDGKIIKVRSESRR